MTLAIEIHQLCVTYESRSARQRVEALRGVTLSVPVGSVVGFLGPNGAGKTTAIHVMLGFIEPTSGEVRLLGEDVRRSISRRRLGYLPERPELYPFLSGRELLAMSGRLFGLPSRTRRERIAFLLGQVGLEQAADRRIGTYSRGMLQRLGLAQALINDPDLVILDEPTGGMDPLGRIEIRNIIQQLRSAGKTVFFSSHELSEVERVCDQVVILSGGRIVAEGAVEQLARPGESLEQVFLRVVKDARCNAV